MNWRRRRPHLILLDMGAEHIVLLDFSKAPPSPYQQEVLQTDSPWPPHVLILGVPEATTHTDL